MMRNTVLRLVLYFEWIFFVVGFECPSCLHVATNNATPANVRDILDNDPFFKSYSNPTCVMGEDGHQNQIQMKSCDDVPGEILLCGHFTGQLTLVIPSLSSKVPLTFVNRDCYNFSKSEMPQTGCMNRTNEAEDIKELNKFVSAAAEQGGITGLKVESVIGELCLYADTKTTVTPKSSAKALFGREVLIGIIFVLVYFCSFLS